MGSSISKMYDNYEDYQYICEVLNEKPMNIQKSIYHETEMLKKHGYKDKYDLFEQLRKKELRDKKLNDIL